MTVAELNGGYCKTCGLLARICNRSCQRALAHTYADAMRRIAEALRSEGLTEVGRLALADELQALSLATCDQCEAPAEHADTYFGDVRKWCDAHTPWSGHFDDCPIPCSTVLARVRRGSL